MSQTTIKITTDSPQTACLLMEINMEVERAEKKHPMWPEDNAGRALIILEEAGEIAKAINDGDHGNLRTEIIQTAATCIRFLKALQVDEAVLALKNNDL